jgi:hypothetical protein
MNELLLSTKRRLTQGLHSLRIVGFYSGLYLIFFSSVLFSGRLLAPGDGMFCYLPNFFKGNMLWDTMLFSGYPIASDPQAMMWYPLSLIFSKLGSWNGFVLSAYVLGSSFTYGYVYTVTQSRLAGLVGGIIYGLSGFMIAHLGHTTIIHTAAWLPLILWSIEKQRLHLTPFWFLVTSIAIALSALSGHPQILVYSLGLSTAYVAFLGWSLKPGRWKYYCQYLVAVTIGLAIASILLVPALEFIRLTSRSKIIYNQFISYSLPPNQMVKLLFPFLFGGLQESFYGFPYFGQWNLAEVTGYAGLLSLMLTGVGIITYRREAKTWFWTGTALIAFLLTLGDCTPLPKIVYHLPLLNKFQAIARHFLLVTLALSILSGLGITALHRQMTSRKLILKVLTFGLIVMLISLIAIFLCSNQLRILATEKGIEKITFLPWSNPAIGVPVIIFLFGSITLLFWSRKGQSNIRQIILISALIIDLASFGWFVDWKYWSPEKSILDSPAFTHRYKSLLQNRQQRMIPIRGVFGSIGEIPPNLSKLYDVPSGSGYASLILFRLTELLSMGVPDGGLKGEWSSSTNQSLDLLSIRYIFVPKNDTLPTPMKDPKGLVWSKEDLPLSLGSGCGLSQKPSVKVNLPVPIKADSIGIVSSMACSTSVSDNEKVVTILVTDTNEKVSFIDMLAGKDTSEWAFDFPEILPLMKHQRANIFSSYSVIIGKQQGEGHRYVTTLSFGKELEIKHLEFQWLGQQATLSIQKISLFDKKQGISYPLSLVMGDLSNPLRWRHIDDINGVCVFENLRAMPRVWLVPEVVHLKKEEVLRAIHSSPLPDGRLFNPYQMALVEEPLTFRLNEWDEKAFAHLVFLTNARIEIQTNSKSPSFLILSEIYYPGWKAFVDGVETHLFQTNYVLRGIMLPAGSHIIHFKFEPRSFYYGAGISAGSLLLLLGLFTGFQWKVWKTQKRKDVPPPDR